MPTEFVQTLSGQLEQVLSMTTLSNHVEIISRCHSHEQKLFYILYAHKEKLSFRELKRSITNQTFESIVGKKENLSQGLLEHMKEFILELGKDFLFVD